MSIRVAVFRPPQARHGTMFELQAALYAHLAAQGRAEVTVFRDAARPFSHPGLRVEPVRSGFGPFAHRLEKSLGVPSYRSAVARLSEYDVIETSDPTLYAYPRVALEAVRRSGGRLVCGSSVSLPGRRTAAAAHARQVMEAAAGILCITPLAHRRFTALGLTADDDPRVVITGHPVDTGRFRPGAGSRGDARERVVLTVARLEAAKGLEEAFDAFAEAPAGWSWWIAGQGSLRKALADRAAARGLAERIRFLGAVPHERMPELYASASILLHLPRATPNWEEYFGATLIEAMAAGVAVLSNRTGAIPWVVGEAGLLADEAAGQALRRLTDDAALRQELGAAGRARVEARFSIDRVADRFFRAWTGQPARVG